MTVSSIRTCLRVVLWILSFVLAPLQVRAEPALRLEQIPHVRALKGFSGVACVEMHLRSIGSDLGAADVFHASEVDAVLGRGLTESELRASLKRLGYPVRAALSPFKSGARAAATQAAFAQLKVDLGAGRPWLLPSPLQPESKTPAYILVVGIDPERERVLFHDPSHDQGHFSECALDAFLNAWPRPCGVRRWSIPGIALASPDGVERPVEQGFTRLQMASHVRELRERLPDDEFSIVLEPPFVVLGDERKRKVRRRSRETVRWAAHHFKKEYFVQDPESIIDIWLFRDEKRYRELVPQIFGHEPPSRYGYMSKQHDALIMNISTGAGTLVHEIVHPFMVANFPHCPPWFDEGLASLYERSHEVDGRIRGQTNWRLAFLQKAIRDDELGTFAALMALGVEGFYNDPLGIHYAQAHYVCYYLQEKELLQAFYATFLEGHAADPTGLKTLGQVLGVGDMTAFQAEWEAYVMQLRFH